MSSPRTRGCSVSEGGPGRRRPVVPAHAGVFRRLSIPPSTVTRRPRARGGVPYCAVYGWSAVVSSPRTRGCSSTPSAASVAEYVVPAHAGVFRAPAAIRRCRSRRPRARGGVPRSGEIRALRRMSSPRTRGCSPMSIEELRAKVVVPAHAGVFRLAQRRGGPHRRRPRARGGVPPNVTSRPHPSQSSPRTRGCSPFDAGGLGGGAVVPAHAGVFRPSARPPSTCTSRPRARGGVPSSPSTANPPSGSSPRTRGCSAGGQGRRHRRDVVPAHAGVFRSRPGTCSRSRRRPRARGGVPKGGGSGRCTKRSSPRTRGCSVSRLGTTSLLAVVPAHAGVFPRTATRARLTVCRPRARGGVPYTRTTTLTISASSPRTRGCSGRPQGRPDAAGVVPAHAGVFPRRRPASGRR